MTDEAVGPRRRGRVSGFAFDANRHEYVDTDAGEVLPHITGMLEACGWIDDRWYTEEGCTRGQVVHRLTTDYDLGAIERPGEVVAKYKGYLLAHVAAMKIIRAEWRHVEEPLVSRAHRFGGRPDRVGLVYAAQAVCEIKSGAIPAPARPAGSRADPSANSHQIQTALQAILVSDELRLPAEAIQRHALYLKDNGRFRLIPHNDLRDFDEARRVIARCC